MKNQFQILVVVVAILMSGSVFAQRGQGKGMRGQMACTMLPDMTDAQQEKIKQLRLDHQQEALLLRNQMGELKAKLRTLETAEKTDLGAINSTIDQIGKVQNQMHKKRAAHKQEVRKVLTDEQRVIFDSRAGKMRKGKMRRGRGCRGRGGKGMGRCNKF